LTPWAMDQSQGEGSAIARQDMVPSADVSATGDKVPTAHDAVASRIDMTSSCTGLLHTAAGPHQHRLALRGLEKLFGLEVAHQVMEYVPRASILALRAKLKLLQDSLKQSRPELLSAFSQLGASAMAHEGRHGEHISMEASMTAGMNAMDKAIEEHITGKNAESELTQAFNDFDLNKDDALDLPEFRQLTKAFILHKRLDPPEDIVGAGVAQLSKMREAMLSIVTPAMLAMMQDDGQMMQAIEPMMSTIEQMLSEELVLVEKEIEQMQRAFEFKYLLEEHTIADQIFQELSANIPDQVLLPDFVSSFFGKMRSLKKKLMNDQIKSLLQLSMNRMMAKLLSMDPQ